MLCRNLQNLEYLNTTSVAQKLFPFATTCTDIRHMQMYSSTSSICIIAAYYNLSLIEGTRVEVHCYDADIEVSLVLVRVQGHEGLRRVFVSKLQAQQEKNRKK